MALRAPAAFDPEPMIDALRLTETRPERLTAARERVLEQAGDGLAWSKSGLAHAAGVTPSVIDGLFAQGVFEPVKLPPGVDVGDPAVRVTGGDDVRHEVEDRGLEQGVRVVALKVEAPGEVEGGRIEPPADRDRPVSQIGQGVLVLTGKFRV